MTALQQRVDFVSLPPQREAEIVIGPWLEDLICQYCSDTEKPARPHRLIFVAATLAALSPALLHLDSEAYPSEPEKRQALVFCSQVDPTFVRFFASERVACYERIVGSTLRAAADASARR